MTIRDSDEFKTRSRRLGKLKNRRKEYNMLEQILADSFPMELGDEPVRQTADVLGYMYFHLEELVPKEQVIPRDITSAIRFLAKVVYGAWDIQPNDPWSYPYEFDEEREASRFMHKAMEIGIDTGYTLPMNRQQARTLLHYVRFGQTDYDRN
ncbi:MAG: hypothetical protein EPN86_01700, partial [Nanoarchaeota archaeon]